MKLTKSLAAFGDGSHPITLTSSPEFSYLSLNWLDKSSVVSGLYWMNFGNFFAELKRRNVYKVAVAYGVVGWLIVQVATSVLPTFHAPDWVAQTLIVIVLLGFPVALVIAWAFEMTPEGMKRTETISPDEPLPQWSKRKFAAVFITLALIAAGLLGWQLLRTKTQSSVGETIAASPRIPEKSIAVLPFDNLSDDKSNAYFTEGVQEEILTRLSKIADLKVIARASTQKFKSAPEDLHDIARQLGVMNVLEGSVQRVGDQVRVNVQLINATNDTHLWAETYDRKLIDIFSVESEIAETIAKALQAQLTGSEKTSIAKAPTTNPEAYELYLKGRFFWNKRSAVDLRKAIDYFNQAIGKDPNYALAYAGLADSYLLLPTYGSASTQEAVPPARAALKKALELDDSLAEAHASSGLLDLTEVRLDRAIIEFERAIELKPNYATAHHWLMFSHLTLGHFDPAIREAKRALELDPLSVIINADFAWAYFCARRFDEAETQARKTLEIDPNFFRVHYYLGEVLQFKGRLSEAIPEYQKAFDLNGDPYSLGMLGQAYARNGQKEEAQKVLAQLNDQAKSRYVAPYAVVLVYLGLGEKGRALDELERAFSSGETNYLFRIKVDPMLDDLRDDPRFRALVEKAFGPKS
jgi:TolB-like protein/Tfp pilus assembly protein PilF